MSDPQMPEAPEAAAPADPPVEGGAGAPVTAARSIALALLAMAVAFGLSLLLTGPFLSRFLADFEPDTGNLFGDIIAIIVVAAVVGVLVFFVLYVVLLVTLLFLFSVVGWAAWGRRTFVLTILAGLGLSVVAVIIMAIIGG